jgi:hypothetical protein
VAWRRRMRRWCAPSCAAAPPFRPRCKPCCLPGCPRRLARLPCSLMPTTTSLRQPMPAVQPAARPACRQRCARKRSSVARPSCSRGRARWWRRVRTGRRAIANTAASRAARDSARWRWSACCCALTMAARTMRARRRRRRRYRQRRRCRWRRGRPSTSPASMGATICWVCRPPASRRRLPLAPWCGCRMRPTRSVAPSCTRAAQCCCSICTRPSAWLGEIAVVPVADIAPMGNVFGSATSMLASVVMTHGGDNGPMLALLAVDRIAAMLGQAQ